MNPSASHLNEISKYHVFWPVCHRCNQKNAQQIYFSKWIIMPFPILVYLIVIACSICIIYLFYF